MSKAFKTNIVAPALIKSGGTSSQYLMADGSVSTGSATTSLNYSQTQATKQSGISASGVTIVSTSITTGGNPVEVLVTGDAENSTAGGWIKLQLYRDSTAIGKIVHVESSAGSENVPYALTVIDTPSAGTYTYALKTASTAATGTFNFGETDGPVLTAKELNTMLPTQTIALSASAPQISLTNGTNNIIKFANVGVAAPTFTSYSLGTKIVLFDNISGSATGHAIGIETGNNWYGANGGHKFYNGTTNTVTIDASGNLSANGTVSSAGLSVTGNASISSIDWGYTTTATAAGTTTLTSSSTYFQVFTGTTTQTVVLPVTSTLSTGHTFKINNNSTGNLTVNSSGGNLIDTVIPGTTITVTCVGTTLTTAADWDAEYDGYHSNTGTGSVVLSTSPSLTTPTIANSTTTATSGLIDFDADSFFFTNNANTSGKGINLAPHMIYRNATNIGVANTATSIFGNTNGITLDAGKLYYFRGILDATCTFNTNNSALQLLWTFSNAPTSISYMAWVENYGTANTRQALSTTTAGVTKITQTTATSITEALSASGSRVIRIEGFFKSNATTGGTADLRYQGSAATSTWTMNAGSWLQVQKVGLASALNVSYLAGNWA